MKRKLTCFILSLLAIATETSQSQNVTNYNFSDTTSTYSTVLLGNYLTGGGWDEQYFTNQDIGFAFFYGGHIYTKLTVYCNGYIMPGSMVSVPSDTMPLTHSNAISVFGTNLAKSNNLFSNIQISTSGTPGNRVCTIQYANVAKKSFPAMYGNAQIKLYEADGTIKFMYGGFTGSFPFSAIQVGLSGASDFNNLKGNDWTNPLSGLNATDTMNAAGTQPANTLPDNSRTYIFTPDTSLVATSPTAISFTNVGLQTITINWSDNSANEVNFAVYDSTNGSSSYTYAGNIIPSTSTAGIGTMYSQTISGLNPGTQYYFNVYALSEGGFSVPLTGSQSTNQPTFPLTVNVPSGSYPSITAAIDSIDTYGLQGNTVITLLPNYTSNVEPSFPIIVPMLPGSNNDTITIRPDTTATNLSILSSSATQTIQLNGAKNIIFDGRPGGIGTSQELSIENNNTSGNAIEFINGAEDNKFDFCTISGTNNSITSGVVFFSTSSSATGNSNNVISNCNLKDGTSTPTNMIYCNGSNPAVNTNNSIINNNIYNFWSNSQNATGILVDTNNVNIIIRKNSFYQTASRTTATATTLLTAINIDNTLNQFAFFTVDSNYIGGTAPMAGGGPMLLGPSGTNVHQFTGISIANYGYLLPLAFINANTIANISINSTPASGSGGTIFTGIKLSPGCASISANSIGSETIASSIFLNSTKPTSVVGIKYNGDIDAAGVITLNKIGGIEIAASGTAGHNFFGIEMNNGINTILSNTIGSTTVPHSIYNKSTANSILNLNNSTVGINVSAGTNTISFNTIANITSSNTNTIASLIGINTTLLATVLSVDHNTVFNLSSKSRSNGAFNLTAAAGIQVDNSFFQITIWNNKVYSIIDSNSTSVATTVTGINLTGSKKTKLDQNIIQGLNNLSSSSSASIIGISNNADSVVCTNSMIRLGLNDDGSSIIQGNTKIYGIRDNNASSNAMSKYYFNTIYIGGNGVVSGSTKSAAFYRETSSVDSVKLKNNIFVNGRSNSTGTGTHYALLVNNADKVVSNYTIYQASGTGGSLFGKTDATAADYTTIPSWQGYAASQDVNSLVGAPFFMGKDSAFDNTHNSNLKLRAYTIAEASGTSILPDTTSIDFEYNVRSSLTPIDIGADAEDFSCTGFLATITSIDTSTCQGDSILLIANMGIGLSYQWLLNNSPINDANQQTYAATASGNYNAIIISDIGCIDTSASITITINPLPTIIYTQTPATVCSNSNPITLSIASPTGGIYSGAGVSGTTFDPNSAGEGTWNIIYSYTDGNGCTDSATQQITVDLCTQRSSESYLLKLEVYPNPTHGQLTIDFQPAKAEIELYTVLGEKVYSTSISGISATNKVDLSFLSNGLYFLILKNENTIVNRKIQIQK